MFSFNKEEVLAFVITILVICLCSFVFWMVL